MKVDGLEAFPLRIRAREDLRGGTFSYSHYQTVIVRADCEGEVGWGEAMTRSDPQATSILVRHLGETLIGREFRSVQEAWKSVWEALRVRGHTRGVDVEALSGIEIALMDSQAKKDGIPLCRLFSKNPERQVPVFAGSLFESRGPVEEQVEVAKSMGLIGAKVKVGFGAEEDARVLGKVRRLWDDGMLVADANGAYDSKAAAKVCDAVADIHLAWLEEPVPSDDFPGYAALRGKGVPIGGGESWFPGDFQRPIDDGLVSVLEPSVSRCGGIGVEIDVARKAVGKGMSFSPMTGMNSAVSLAASLHAAGACPSIGVEFNPFANPLQAELASGIGPPKDGVMPVPAGAGLGIEIDEGFLRKHALR